MNKNHYGDLFFHKKESNKYNLRIPRLIYFLIFLLFFCIKTTSLHAQNESITINKKNVQLKDVLNEIEKQTEYLFVYDKKVDINRIVSVEANHKPLKDVLNGLFSNINISFTRESTSIILKSEGKDILPQKKKTVTGLVKDSNGEPIIGASVGVKGSSIGVMTDVDGKFSLSIPEDTKNLVFSYVGMKTIEVQVNDKTSFSITMEDTSLVMDEVVVTALGIKKEVKSLTYNVQQIGGDEVSRVKDVNVMSSLAGKVAGVNINTSAAGIGGGARVVMRGTKSISGNNNALYVVDGVPLPNSTGEQPDDQYKGAGQSGDGISNFNADDIESISILSGSAAAALYGSAAANGVVLITTKKGQTDKTSVSYSNNTSFYSPLKTPKFQNRYGSETGEWYSWSSLMTTPSTYDATDFFQTGYNVTNTVSLTTGNSKNQTYASIGSVNARGIIQNNELDRYNFSVRNSSSMLQDKLHLDLSFMYSNVEEQNMLAQGEYANPLVAVYLFPRGDDIQKYQYYERFDVDRNINVQFWPLSDNGLSMQNPYWITNRNMYVNKKNRYLVSGSLKYDIKDWLNVAGRVRLDDEHTGAQKKMYASTLTVLAENSDKGAYIETEKNTRQIYADAMANIDKYFSEDWNLNASAGMSLLDLNHKELQFGGGLKTIPNLFTVNNVDVAGKLTYLNNNYHERTNSIFGTFSLGYKGMAYVNASLRNDWLSALSGTDHTSILYPSIGASMIFTNMIEKKSNILTYAKGRFSYSEVGNAPERFRAITTYSVLGGLNTTSYFPITDLSPERTHSWEAGLNLAMFKDKLTLDLTVYRSYTENQLFSPEISTTTGYSKLYVNAGKVTNKGVELSLGYKQNLGPVNWKTTALWSLNRNRIDQLLPEYTNEALGVTVRLDALDVYMLGGAKQRLTVGGSMGDVYVNTMRTDADGAIWVNSMTGALETDKNNYVYAGNTNPKYNLSWRNEFNWKGLSMGVMLSARVGGIGVSATQAVLDYYGVSEASALARDNGGVSINGQLVDAQTWYQTIGANGTGYVGSMYVYSMTNVRLGELTLGYDLPVNKWCNWIKGVNFSLIGRNLFMIYCKAPFDPESTASTGTYNQGMDYFMQPSLRSLGFSAKITF